MKVRTVNSWVSALIQDKFLTQITNLRMSSLDLAQDLNKFSTQIMTQQVNFSALVHLQIYFNTNFHLPSIHIINFALEKEYQYQCILAFFFIIPFAQMCLLIRNCANVNVMYILSIFFPLQLYCLIMFLFVPFTFLCAFNYYFPFLFCLCLLHLGT